MVTYSSRDVCLRTEYLHNVDKIFIFRACTELYSTDCTNTTSAPFCHDIRKRLLPIGRPTTRLSAVAHAYRFPIGRPFQYTGFLLATHINMGLHLYLPHTAEIGAFCHALSRRYCVVAIRHVSGGRDFVPLRPSDISNLALALAELASCYCSPHLLKDGACGLAP